jgi:Peptidase family S41
MQIKRFFQAIPFLAGLFFLPSCELALVNSDFENSPIECFEFLSRTIKEKYAFLEYKRVNWDSIVQANRPRVNNDMSQDSLFKVLADMLYQLRDGHVNLQSDFNVSRNWEWYLGYPENYRPDVVERNYLGKDYLITGSMPNQILPGNVGYIRYGSFSNPIGATDFEFVMERFKNTRGLIIDIRNNGGGAISNANLMFSYFIKEKTAALRYLEKSGPGPKDFSGPFVLNIDAAEKQYFAGKTIVVMTNRSSYSAASFFPAMMSVLPNVVLLGDTSGGGGGLPTSNQLPNGWSLRYSSTITTTMDGFNYEDGMPVDVKVDLDPVLANRGVDSMIERALREIK